MAGAKLLIKLNQESGEYDLRGAGARIKTPFWAKILGVGQMKAVLEGKETIYYAVVLDLFGKGVPALMNFGEVAFNRFVLGLAAALKNGDISPDSPQTERYIIFDSGYDVVPVMGGMRLIKVPKMRFYDKPPALDEKVYPEVKGIEALKAGLAALPSLEDAGISLADLIPIGAAPAPEEEAPEGDEFA